GDVAERTQDGMIRVLGRTSIDILKSGGYKISALEIEEALREHEAIGGGAVVGVPDPTWGARVGAAAVPLPGRAARCGAAAVRGWAKERLAPYKVPREFVVMNALPRTPLGKVIKPDVVALIREQIS